MSETAACSLDSIELLAPVPQAERDALVKECRWRRFAAQEQIIDRQEDGRDVFFVVDGRVRIVNYSLLGREISFDDLSTGSFFGELAAIDGRPRSASVVALQPTSVAAMPASIFKRVVSEYPPVALATITHLARVVRQATDRIMDLSTLGANNRVHAELLRLAVPRSPGDRTAVIAPIPVHSDIAGRVSTTRETVARVLSDLARSGLVVKRSDHLLVPDLRRLQTLVEDVRGD